MPSPDAVERRLVEVETRLAFQEQALAELSDALAQARAEVTAQADLLRRTLAGIKPSGGDFFPDPADEPPPPHY